MYHPIVFSKLLGKLNHSYSQLRFLYRNKKSIERCIELQGEILYGIQPVKLCLLANRRWCGDSCLVLFLFTLSSCAGLFTVCITIPGASRPLRSLVRGGAGAWRARSSTGPGWTACADRRTGTRSTTSTRGSWRMSQNCGMS